MDDFFKTYRVIIVGQEEIFIRIVSFMFPPVETYSNDNHK